MPRWADHLRRLLPGLWAGALLGLAALGTPAPFAVLERAQAGLVVGHIFLREAHLSLVLGAALLALERWRGRGQAAAGQGPQFTLEMALAGGTLLCTLLGYFAVQPQMALAKAGQGAFTFGQLHAFSFFCYGMKTLLVLALAWRCVRLPAPQRQPA